MDDTPRVAYFNRQFIRHIQRGHSIDNVQFQNPKVIKARDGLGTLLHHAAAFGNARATRRLIQVGSDINELTSGSQKSPLMLAVQQNHVATAEILLRANANIELTSATGKSVLQRIFERNMLYILPLILKKLRTEGVNDEALAAKLTSHGCKMYHAVFFRDFGVMKSMLEYGIDVNARAGDWNKTALHAAVEISDINLTKWLVHNGADINAVDARGNNALFFIDAHHENSTALIQFLVENGTDPNAMTPTIQDTVLFNIFSSIAYPSTEARVIECIELLFEYEAIPHNCPYESYTIFDHALMSKSSDRIELLIAHISLLRKMGILVSKNIMTCRVEEHKEKLEKLTDYYKQCEQVLDIVMFQNISLLALLTDREFKMKTYVRNDEFKPKIQKVCYEHELQKLYPYYYKRLMKRISKAIDLVELENTATPILIGLFCGNGNEYYIPARKIVGYLDKCDLQQLVHV